MKNGRELATDYLFAKMTNRSSSSTCAATATADCHVPVDATHDDIGVDSTIITPRCNHDYLVCENMIVFAAGTVGMDSVTEGVIGNDCAIPHIAYRQYMHESIIDDYRADQLTPVSGLFETALGGFKNEPY